MTPLVQNLRSGDWLQRDRLAFYPLLILVITAAATAYVLISNGGTLPNGSPFGSDFVSFWVAAREALAGNPELPYATERLAAAQNAIFRDGNYYAFYYPPHYLAYLLPLGGLPYYAALAVWAAFTLALALFAISAIVGVRRETFILTLAFPATFLTVAHGQNAFLSAALFGGALWLLPARPVLAGILLGLLTYKPQLGILIPFALLAAGHWRAILSATATTTIVIAASASLFGIETWQAFLAQSGQAMETLRYGHVGWNKMISTYAGLRLFEVPHFTAMVAQAAVSLCVLGALILVWRRSSRASAEVRNAMLLCGALLATPFGLNYDLFILAPAIAFICARGMKLGFEPWQKTGIAVVYCSPFVLLWLMGDGIPVAPQVLALLFAHLFWIALTEDRRASVPVVPAPAE